MGLDRSARVSAVGRSENLALDALQGAAVTRGLACDANIITQKQVPGARSEESCAQFSAFDARCMQVCGHLRDGIATPLRLSLDRLDGITGLLVIDPRGALTLLEDPPTSELNTKAQFSIGVGARQFGVNHLALILQSLDLLGDLHAPEQHGVSAQIRQMRESVCLDGDGCQHFGNGFHGSLLPDALILVYDAKKHAPWASCLATGALGMVSVWQKWFD